MAGNSTTAFLAILLAPLALLVGTRSPAAERVALRVESFLVAPAHSPSAVVWIKNLQQEKFAGRVGIQGPADWRFEPREQDVALDSGEVSRLRFLVRSGTNRADNRYPITVVARQDDVSVVHRQEVRVASAPYFKPEIDGAVDDWKDAIPLSWTTRGKRTTVSTHWNRRQFAVLVAVEEDNLLPYGTESAWDAVQLAIASEDALAVTESSSAVNRYEFLLVALQPQGAGRCFQLADPDTKADEVLSARSLEPAVYGDAQLAVRRDGSITYYECSLPWAAMRAHIAPGEGREFRFSVLVHDADGVGLRDWGEGAGFWASERNRLAWSNWKGARWPNKPPFDSRIPWGMCSSKY